MPNLLYKYEKILGGTSFVNIASSSSKDEVNKVEISFRETTSTDKIALNLYVLDSLMKDNIDINSILIVTVHRHRTIHTKSKLPQQDF